MLKLCRRILGLGILSSSILIIACSFESAGRPGGDETTNHIATRIIDTNGVAMAHILVRARPANWLPFDSLPLSEALLQDSTDDSGRVSLDLPPGLWRVEAIGKGLGCLWTDSAIITTAVKDRILQSLGRLTGVAKAGSRVGILGLGYWTTADSAGKYLFPTLPAGVFDVRSLEESQQSYVQINPSDSIYAGPLVQMSDTAILLEDFEDGDMRHRYGPAVTQGWWYISGYPSAFIFPAGVPNTPRLGLTFDSVANSNVFHMVFTPDTTSYPWAEVGVNLGGLNDANLSQLQSIHFTARGTGEFCLRIVSPLLEQGQTLSHCTILDSTWTTYRIPIDSIVLTSDTISFVTKNQLLTDATGISWSTTKASEIWLDDIWFNGLSPKQVWGTIAP